MPVDKPRSASATERMIRLYEYLKKNTDENNTVQPKDVREYFSNLADSVDSDIDFKRYFGTKNTFHSLVINLATTFNTDLDEISKSSDDWSIIFDDYTKYYDDNISDADETDVEDKDYMQIKNLYYKAPLSYQEIDTLIEGIQFSRTIPTDEADAIIDRIEKHLVSKHYKKNARIICRIREAIGYDKETLRKNLLIIQEAILEKVQITFQFNYYDKDKKLAHAYTHMVSPYYIVANNGKYYLLAAKDNHKNTSIWRIDLMTELAIIGEETNDTRINSLPINEIENMPPQWDDNFSYTHLNMSFDWPRKITLRIINPVNYTNSDTQQHNYTFLHEAFGDNYKWIKTEGESPFGDIVEVRCSPYGMVNWALQFADTVEVLEPKHVRDDVIKKINNLNGKYEI